MPRLLIQNLNDPATVTAAGELFRSWTMDPTQWQGLSDAQVLDALKKAGLKFEPSVTGVHVMQSTTSTLQIRLPPAECLQQGRDDIEDNHTDYKLPDIITDFVEDRRTGGPLYDEPHEVLHFYDFRLGDYTLQHCM